MSQLGTIELPVRVTRTEKVKKTLHKLFGEGRYGFTLTLKDREWFVGLLISSIYTPPVVRRPIPKKGNSYVYKFDPFINQEDMRDDLPEPSTDLPSSP